MSASPGGGPTFDLQSHSVHSDGLLPPAEVVAAAAQAGVHLLALSDHDTVDGVDEALEAGARERLSVVPAVEISAVHEGYEDLHVLGYRVDHHHFLLTERLSAFRDDRVARAEAMTARLNQLGWAVDEDALAARRATGRPLGRPHLAAAVFSHPDNQERLREEGLADASALLAAYLIPGAPAYRPRTFPTVPEAIEVIHEAGGVAVWAHPFWDMSSTPDVLAYIERFQDWGLDGVEAFYPTHEREQVLAVVDLCERLDLLRTGSSDFHGPGHRLFSRFLAFELQGCEPALGPIAEG
jgi:predicted metal-dependent phosphoesterase TrpH